VNTLNLVSENRKKVLKPIIEKCAKEDNFKIEDYKGKGSYVWLSKVLSIKDYTFKRVVSEVNTDIKDIYNDFNDLSRYIHSNDYLTKMDFYDPLKMSYLSSLLLKYTDRILNLLDKRALKNNYNVQYYKVAEALLWFSEDYLKNIQKSVKNINSYI